MLDELPYGDFVEIEGETNKSILTIADKLTLKWDTVITTSYHALFERLCAKHPSLDPTDLPFTALRGLSITVKELPVQAGDDY